MMYLRAESDWLLVEEEGIQSERSVAPLQADTYCVKMRHLADPAHTIYSSTQKKNHN